MGIIHDVIAKNVLRKWLKLKNALETACIWSIIFFQKACINSRINAFKTFMQQVKVLLGSHYLSMQHYYS